MLVFKRQMIVGVVYKYLPEEFVYVVKGEQFNMKLTYKEDLFLLDKIVSAKINRSTRMKR